MYFRIVLCRSVTTCERTSTCFLTLVHTLVSYRLWSENTSVAPSNWSHHTFRKSAVPRQTWTSAHRLRRWSQERRCFSLKENSLSLSIRTIPLQPQTEGGREETFRRAAEEHPPIRMDRSDTCHVTRWTCYRVITHAMNMTDMYDFFCCRAGVHISNTVCFLGVCPCPTTLYFSSTCTPQ